MIKFIFSCLFVLSIFANIYAKSYKAYSSGDTLIYKIDTSIHTGKLYVIDFFTSYCRPCFDSFSHYEKLIEKYSDNRHISFFYANFYDDSVVVEKIRMKHGLTRPVVLDTSKTYFNLAGNMLVPKTLILDKSFNVLWEGLTTLADEQLIDNLLQNPDFKPELPEDSIFYLLSDGKMFIRLETNHNDSAVFYRWNEGFFNREVEIKNRSIQELMRILFEEAGLMNYQLKFSDQAISGPAYNLFISCPIKRFSVAVDTVINALCNYNNLIYKWQNESIDIFSLKIKDCSKLSSIKAAKTEGMTLYNLSLLLTDITGVNIEFIDPHAIKYLFPQNIYTCRNIDDLGKLLASCGLELEYKAVMLPVLTISNQK